MLKPPKPSGRGRKSSGKGEVTITKNRVSGDRASGVFTRDTSVIDTPENVTRKGRMPIKSLKK